MSGIKARKWVVKRAFDGLPKRDDFEIVEEELPPIKDGEFLLQTQWISVDPYLRTEEGQAIIGNKMNSFQVGKVIQSKHKDYAVGDLVSNYFGWVTHGISNGDPKGQFNKLDSSNPLPSSTALGILGMPGATAYFGLLDICKPKSGETLLVNAAAGAVGSAVGQIGKIKGMRVVGFAGSDEKVAYLKSIGFDAAFNYKTITSLSDAIKEGCPNGVDVFFDNVGGEFFATALMHMNSFGRVSVCGAISEYNNTELSKTQNVSPLILFRQLTVQGFIVLRWIEQWPEAFKEMTQWIQEGKLQYKETVFEGFDNVFEAFVALFTGKNIGKIVVKV